MEPMDKLERFASKLRLLEAAGVADGLSRTTGDAYGVFAQLCRNYHAALTRARLGNLDLATLAAPGIEAHSSMVRDVARLQDEVVKWSERGVPYAAYPNFLIAYEAMQHLDGDRMMAAMGRVADMLDAAGFSDPKIADIRAYCGALEAGPEQLKGIWSSYEAMQATADVLTDTMQLTEHALSDVSRFALSAPIPTRP